MFNHSIILEAKDNWSKSGFVGGVILCDFLLMREMQLDIIDEDELVKEYRNLLKQRLETENMSLILMVNTEIEKCYIDRSEEIYEYLCDEIYEHFKNNNAEYPIQAVGIHIDIITSLIYLGEKECVYHYLHSIQETYEETFGKGSYLFCKNWCYILNEVLLEFIPTVAIKEFMDNIDLFSGVLREEEILYTLCINIAVKRTKQEQNVDYIREAITLCEKWYRGTSIEKQKKVQPFVKGTAAMYYRNIGEYDIAIKLFEEVIELTDNINYKLFLLSQIGSILYLKHDVEQLERFFEKNEYLFRRLQEPDESVAELYNIYASYYMFIEEYEKACIEIKKAIEISEQIFGKDADLTLKFKCNKCLIEFNSGEFDKSNEQMKKLLNIVFDNPKKYVESMPLILNSLLAISFENKISSSMVLKMKRVLEIQSIKYDIASNIMFKCNLYCIMMFFGTNCDDPLIENLQKELENYFKRYPYSEGYLVYLRGEFYRLYQKNISLGYEALGRIEEYFDKIKISNISREYVMLFIIKLKKYIYLRNYVTAKRWLISSWENVFLPLFKTLINKNEENAKGNCLLLHTYISLFVSSARQYPQLKITDKELYEFVLNFKYLEDLFYCNKQKFKLVLEKERWLSADSILLSKEKFILECFCYGKYNMDEIQFFGVTNYNDSSEIYQICFGLEHKTGFFSKHVINVIGEISFTEFSEKIMDMLESQEVSILERDTWKALKKFINKKEQMYICSDLRMLPITLGSMRIDEERCWGEICQIIYCNTAKDVKDDISIRDFSNSMYLGMSTFNENQKSNGQKIQKKFGELPYVKLEIERLVGLTSGKAYLDGEISKTWLDGQKKDIIHFATHTTEYNTEQEKALIIGKDNNGEYITLKNEEMAKLDWNGVKLVVLSACETGEETWEKIGRNSLSQAVKKAGVQFSISTLMEVEDAVNAFFMVCFYKNLLVLKKISKAFFETQKTMRTITKQEILSDSDYLAIGMEHYLQDYEVHSIPFESVDNWAIYMLQMN